MKTRRSGVLPRASEALEDRTLLASNLIFTAAVGTPHSVTLLMVGPDVQIVDSNDFSNVLATEQAANITSGVQVSGNGFNLNLTIDSSVPQIAGGILFTGGSGTNTLTGPVADTTWRVTGAGAGDLTSGLMAVQFTGVETLTGGSGRLDTFIVSPTGSLTGGIHGQTNDNDSVTVQLQANASTQTLLATAGATVTAGSVQRNGTTVVGYDGMSAPVGLTVVATSGADAVVVGRGASAGTVTVRSTNSVPTFGAVTVTLRSGTVAGVDMGDGDDSLTMAASTMDAVLEGGEIEVDGGSGTNSMTSLAAKNDWSIAAQNAGLLNQVVSFKNVQNLTGSDQQDSFNFADGASLTGTVDGAGGQNTLDYSAYTTAVAVNFGTHAATGTASAINYDTVIGGSAADTLVGPVAETVWRIDDVNSGYLLNGDETVLTFSAIENLTGAAPLRDVFVIEKEGSISGTVSAAAAGRSGLLVQSDVDDSFTVVNPQPGITSQQITVNTKTITYAGLNPFVSPTTTASSTIAGGEVESKWRLGDAATAGQLKITNLFGQFYDVATHAIVDTLTFAKPTTSLTIVLGEAQSSLALDAVTGPLAIDIQAGDGFNSLFASSGVAHQWTITDFNEGTVDGYGSTTVHFTGIGTLIGGDQDDTFVFANNAASVDGIDGGTGGTDTLDYRNTTGGVTVTLGAGNDNIDAVIGGSGVDTLVGVADDNEWAITSTNGGNVVTNRHSTTLLDDTTVIDTVAKTIRFPVGTTFTDGEQVTYITDLTGGADTSGLTSHGTYYVKLIDEHTIQLSNSVGGAAISLGTSPWANGNSLIVHATVEIYRVTFSNFENLGGSVGDDEFVLSNTAGVTGWIDGGAGDNTIDYSAYTTDVTVRLGDATVGASTGAPAGVRNMTSIVAGNSTDTLFGPANDAIWRITGVNTGSIDAVPFTGNGINLTRAVTFTGFENLTGQSGFQDAFFLLASGSISGQISGGADHSGNVAIEDPANPGAFAYLIPTAGNSATVSANTIYPNAPGVTAVGIEAPIYADTSTVGVTKLRSNMVLGSLSLTQDASGNLVLASTDTTSDFYDVSTSQFVTGSLTTPVPAGTTRMELSGGGTVTIGKLDLDGVDLVITSSGNYTFADTILTHGGKISVMPEGNDNNETIHNVETTITVNAGVILNTRQTNISGVSIAASGDITFKAFNITIGADAQLLSYDDRTSASSGNIPLGIANQSLPANAWLPGRLYRDQPTTSNGSGTGMRVDVITDNYGNPTVIMRTPGSGYADHDVITVEEPEKFLTGSTSFHNGSDLTFEVNGIQKAGGSISLSAYHHAQAIAYSYNPIDVSVTINSNAVIKGRDVSIIADADNSRIFDDSEDRIGTLDLVKDGFKDINNYLKQKTEALLDFLINFRVLVGVSLSKASATVNVLSGTTITATGGNVLTEAFARSKAQAFTLGLTVGFTYARSDATATVDVQGRVTSDIGSVSIVATAANIVDATTKTTSAGPLKRKNPYSVSLGVTEAHSHSTVTIGVPAVITAARDVNLWAANAKSMSTTVSASSDDSKLGISVAVVLNEATANVNVAGDVTGMNVSIVSQTMGDKDATSVKFQNGQPIRSNRVNKITSGIQVTRALVDGLAGSPDAAAAAGAIIGALLKLRSDRNYGLDAEKLGERSQEGHSVGVIVGAFSFNTNTATATVAGTATISATGTVLVHANVIDRPDVTAQGLANVMSLPGVTKTPGKTTVGIAVGYGDFTNQSQAIVQNGAVSEAAVKLDVAANTRLPYEIPWDHLDLSKSLRTTEQIVGRLLQHLGDDNLGLADYFTTFVQSTATGNKSGYAVSGDILALTNGAEARIENGARINPNVVGTSACDVSVTAKIDSMAMNLIGNFPQIMDAVFGSADRATTVRNSGKESGFGGSFSVMYYGNTTQAVIESGAQVKAHDITVDALTEVKNISLGISGGKSDSTAVNGVANVVVIDDKTLAQIGQGAIITASGKVDVTAKDDPLVVNLAGGVTIGSSVGFGITVGTNVILRDTKAIIGNEDVTLGNGNFTPGTGVNAADETINLGYVHGFSTGDQVVYSNGGDTSIAGLVDGSTYYVKKITSTSIGLGRSLAEVNGTAPGFRSSSITNDVIDLGYTHGFQTGDAVVYNNGGGTNLGDLVSGKTYYVIRVDATRVKLADTSSKAAAGTAHVLGTAPAGTGTSHSVRLAMDPFGNRGVLHNIGRNFVPATAVTSTYDSVNLGYADGFQRGQPVVYSAGNDPLIGGLVDNTVYYVVPDASNPNAFHLAATFDDAMRASPTLLSVTPASGAGSMSGFGAAIDPSSAVSAANDTINLGYSHGFSDGDVLIYSNGGGGSIGGLTSGNTYYVKVVNDTKIKLSETAAGVTNGPYVDLSLANTTGKQHSFRRTINPQAAVTGGDATTAETINLGYTHGFATGDRVLYSNGGGTSIGGLANKNAYFVIVVNATTIRLADSLANAQRGIAIDLDATVATGSNHSIARAFQAIPTVDAAKDTIRVPNANQFHNGQEVVYNNGGGTSIGGLTQLGHYYVTVVDSSTIKLSTSNTSAANREATVVNLDPSTATGTGHFLSDPKTGTGSFSSTGATTLHATNDGLLVTVTIAAAKTGDPPEEGEDANAGEAVRGQKNGQAVSGSVSVNYIADTTEAYIRGTTLTNVGGVKVWADNSPMIVAVSGAAALSKNSSNTAKNVGLAGAVTINVIDNHTHAFVQDATLTNVGAVVVDAEGSAGIVSIAAGFGGSSRGTGIAGSVAVNIINSETAAYLNRGSISASSLNVTAHDASSIITVAGSLAYGGKLGIGAGIAVNLVTTTVDAHMSNMGATISGALNVQALNATHITGVAAGIAIAYASTPVADPDAEDAAEPTGKQKSLALAIAVSVNHISPTVKAYLSDDGTHVVSAGSLLVKADDTDTWIVTVAGGVAVGLSRSEKSGAIAGAGGAAFAFNKINTSVAAYIDNFVVTATSGTVEVNAHSKDKIEAYAIGGAVAGAKGAGTGGSAGIAGAGSFTFNDIYKDLTASIQNHSAITTTGSQGVTVRATDESTIKSLAGSIALAAGLGGTGGGGLGVAVGASVASNTIQDKTAGVGIQATISHSTVVSGGDIVVSATSTPTIDATAFAGTLAVGTSGKASAAAFSGAGAGADNDIELTVHAAISDTPAKTQITDPAPLRSLSGSILVSASDTSKITAVAVGASIGIAVGEKYAAGIAIGVSVALNEIDNHISASVTNAEIAAAQNVSITAFSNSTIDATSVAASVSFANGDNAFAISGGGAGSTNVILTKTNAFIENSFVRSIGDVNLTSTNNSRIDASIVSATLALGFGKKLGVGVAVGAAVAKNLIGYGEDADTAVPAEIQAYVRNSTIDATGNLSLIAKTENLTIDATVVAASAAIAAGRQLGIAAAGSGADVENRIAANIKSFIDYVPNVQVAGATAGTFEPVNGTIHADDITLTASDTSTITATAVGASLAGSYGDEGAVAIAIGVSQAHNDVRNNVAAYISNADKNSTLATDFGVTFGGTLTVQATEHATITATAVAASIAAGFSKGGALALSGAGAESTNVILTNTNAYIQDSRIKGTGTGGVTVSANNDSRITATIVGASLAVGAGKDNGVGVSIGAALASNFIGWDPKAGSSQGVGQTQAFVTDSSMIISGALSATATATQVVNATVIAASAAFSGGKELGVSLAGAGADSLNQVANTVQAYIDGDTSGGIHAGSVSVIADDTSTITAVTVGATLAAAFSGQTGVALAVGVSLAANIITSQTAAYIKDADDIDSAGAIIVSAKNRAAIHSVSVAASLAVGLAKTAGIAISGAGAESTNIINTATNAYVEDSILEAVGSVSVTADAGPTGGTQTLTPVGNFTTGLDDASATDMLDTDTTIDGTLYKEGTPDPTDVAADNAFKTTLQAQLAVAGIDLSTNPDDLEVTTRKLDLGADVIDPADDTGIEWSVTDRTSGVSVIITKDSQGHFTVFQPQISATVVGAALSIGVGKDVGAGLAIGASVARNLIGAAQDDTAGIRNDAIITRNNPTEVRARILNSSITSTGGSLTVTATAQQSIDAFVGAFAGAVGGSSTVGLAGAGAGSRATNGISMDVTASIDGDGSTGIHAKGIAVQASDSSSISVVTGAVSLAVAFGAEGAIALAAGGALAENVVQNEIQAYITNTDDVATTSTGAITVTASETATIDSTAFSAAVAVAVAQISFGGAAAVLGAQNSLLNDVTAYISDSGSIQSAQGVSVSASDTGVISAYTFSLAIAGGLIGIGTAIGSAENFADDDVTSYVADSSITANAGDINVTATSTPSITTSSVTVAVSVAIGASAAVFDSKSTVDGTVEAYLMNATLTATGHAVDVSATSTGTLSPDVRGGAGGLVAVGVMLSKDHLRFNASPDGRQHDDHCDQRGTHSDRHQFGHSRDECRQCWRRGRFGGADEGHAQQNDRGFDSRLHADHSGDR